MTEYMKTIGAVSPGKITCRDYEVETPYGMFGISFTDSSGPGQCEHLHCVFEDVKRAYADLGDLINEFTGKYNTYVFERCTAQYAFENILKPHIERAMRHPATVVPAPTMAEKIAALVPRWELEARASTTDQLTTGLARAETYRPGPGDEEKINIMRAELARRGVAVGR